MANATSGTLTANTATSNVMVNEGPNGVQVVNRSFVQGATTEPIWVSLTSTPPTVAGADCFPVFGARLFEGDEIGSELRLISAYAADYTVERA